MKSPNCLLSKNPPQSLNAGTDHTLNPAFSPLILPQLPQQMVHESTPLQADTHSKHTHTDTRAAFMPTAPTAPTQVTGREGRGQRG